MTVAPAGSRTKAMTGLPTPTRPAPFLAVRRLPKRMSSAGVWLAAILAWPASAAVRPSAHSSEIRIDDRGDARERRIIERALARIGSSPTARRLERRHRRLAPVTVSFAPISEGTATAIDVDLLGRTLVDQSPPAIKLNERLVVSTRTLVEVLAHELYGHDLILREARERGVELGYLTVNEGFSLAVGYLIAREAGEAALEDDAVDYMAESTGTYCAHHLFRDSPERIELCLPEARDARSAIAARLKEVARRRRSLAVSKKDLAVWNFYLSHLEQSHGLDRRAVARLREDLDSTAKDQLPTRRALLDAAEPHLKKVLAWLDEPEGRGWVARMSAAWKNPYTAALHEEWAGIGRRTSELRASRPERPKPPDPRPAVQQLDWDEVSARIAKDRAEHADHFKNEPKTDPPVAWIVPWPRER